MNSKNIKKHLKRKLADWIASIDDPNVQALIKENSIITGGALVSLLTGEPVNDYDVYFRDQETARRVAQYYADKWNADPAHKSIIITTDPHTGKIDCFIQSDGAAGETENNAAEDLEAAGVERTKEEQSAAEKEQKKESKGKYRPCFFTSNAISLSDKIQIVIRFYGTVKQIHSNFDFAHCTCAWSSWDNDLFLPTKALECIINKELFYQGSRYPLCSIIRTRKYLNRGYHINAGQYVKMALQLNELNLRDPAVLKDQLTGVDTSYFQWLIELLQKHLDETVSEEIDTNYAIELIDKLF